MIDALAGERHFIDHMAPVWRALPAEVRGCFVVPDHLAMHAAKLGVAACDRLPDTSAPTLVASFGDHKRARLAGREQLIVMEHGIGQSYANGHGAYPGGTARAGAVLFLCPNRYSASRWRAVYPDVPAVVIGSPRLDDAPRRQVDDVDEPPVVAVSFHWNCMAAPETRSAFLHYRSSLPALAARYRVIGHGHPRMLAVLEPNYRRFGIEIVPEFDDVLRRADVYVCDNSSTIYEFAATGRPVVVLNAPWFRRDVDNGLRFWEAADVGVQCDGPDELVTAVDRAVEDPPAQRVAREAALSIVYGRRKGASAAAARAIVTWLNRTRNAA